jgi:hypothetical protein
MIMPIQSVDKFAWKTFKFSKAKGLSYKYFFQKLPKSDTFIYWIVFQGNCEEIEDFKSLKWRIEEFAALYSHAVVIDVSQVEFGLNPLEKFESIFGSKWYEFSRLVFIAESSRVEMLKKLISKERVTTTTIAAFSKMVWEYRKDRFEGGKTLSLPWNDKLPEMKSIEFNLDDLSEIKCECFEFESQNKNIGLISFDGIYRYGSAGKYDGYFISRKLRQFYEALQPFAMITDCTKLEYEWGDEFDVRLWFSESSTLKDNEGNLRYRVIIPKEKKEQLKYGIEEKFIVENLDKALAEFN